MRARRPRPWFFHVQPWSGRADDDRRRGRPALHRFARWPAPRDSWWPASGRAACPCAGHCGRNGRPAGCHRTGRCPRPGKWARKRPCCGAWGSWQRLPLERPRGCRACSSHPAGRSDYRKRRRIQRRSVPLRRRWSSERLCPDWTRPRRRRLCDWWSRTKSATTHCARRPRQAGQADRAIRPKNRPAHLRATNMRRSP